MLHSFNGSAGRGPVGVVFDAAGNLYGTTFEGGFHMSGTAFKLTPNADGSWTESLIHKFKGRPAEDPVSGLILDSAGTLYGTTANCSSGCRGVVYQITP